MREQFKAIRKLIEARLDELKNGDLEIDLDKITLSEPIPKLDTLKLD